MSIARAADEARKENVFMKMMVVCAAGRAGRLIVSEAMRRGHEVTAVARNAEAVPTATNVLVRDLFDLTREDVLDYEVVIDAFGAWTPDTLSLHSDSLRHLCDLVSGSKTRLLVVGGAGSLYINPEHTACVADGPDFPDAFKPLASAMAKALAELRNREDVRWTYLSPAADFRVDGAKMERFLIGGEELLCNGRGESVISYADYAIAMIDEAERAEHVCERFSVVQE